MNYWMHRFNILVGFLCTFFFINSQLMAIISFEEGMGEDFNLQKFPLANLFKISYERNNYENAFFHKRPYIPKIIHQIWVGGELPERFKKLTATWKKKHPEWTYKLWTDADVATFTFINKDAFMQALNMGAKADVWRYEILNTYGGVYLDIDYECIKPLDVLHHTCNFYAAACGADHFVGNGVIGSAPHHPILEDCIKKIGLITVVQLQDPWTYTGPKLLTRCLMSYLWKNRDNAENKTAVYPVLFFHPFPSQYRKEYWKGMLSREFIDSFLVPETFAIHFWATSWQ